MSWCLHSKAQSWDLMITCAERLTTGWFCIGLVARPWTWPNVLCYLVLRLLCFVKMVHPLVCTLQQLYSY